MILCASQKSIVIEQNKQQYQSLNETLILGYSKYKEDKQKICILFENTGNICKSEVYIRLYRKPLISQGINII